MPEKFRQQEQIVTPERSEDELYLNALEFKRDTILAFNTMNSFKGKRSFEDMSEEDLEKYKILREDFRNKREISSNSWGGLSDEKQKTLFATGLRLYDVQTEITLLKNKTEGGLVKGSEPVVSAENQEVSQEPVATVPSPEQVSPVRPETVEQPTNATSLEMGEAEKMLKFSKDTGRVLEVSYWESKISELNERKEAEANPDRTPPKGFLQKVKESFDRVRGIGPIEESRMNPLGLRESLPDKNLTAKETTQVEPEKEPIKPTKWTWFKERAKGIWNFGIWEFHQAERFRSQTKEASVEAKALATLIQQERDMTVEEAQKEAGEIQKMLKGRGLEGSAVEITRLSEELSEKKRKENDDEVNYIINTASNSLLDRLQKYRGEAGQDVLTAENKKAFQEDLRMQLNKMRDGFMKDHVVNLAEVMRRNLDENWWRRYIWGAAEAMIGFAGVKFLTLKLNDWMSAAKMVQAENIGGAKELVSQKMHENVWTTLKEMAQNGPQHLNPTDSELMDLSKKVLDTNGMYEPEWVNKVMDGLRSSRTLPEGMPLKIPLEVMKALGL